MEDTVEVNNLKLKIKAIEIQEKQLTDSILSGNLNMDMIELLNHRASQLKEDKFALRERFDEIKNLSEDTEKIVELAKYWKRANYERKKAVASILVHQILISENDDTKIVCKLCNKILIYFISISFLSYTTDL